MLKGLRRNYIVLLLLIVFMAAWVNLEITVLQFRLWTLLKGLRWTILTALMQGNP